MSPELNTVLINFLNMLISIIPAIVGGYGVHLVKGKPPPLELPPPPPAEIQKAGTPS